MTQLESAARHLRERMSPWAIVLLALVTAVAFTIPFVFSSPARAIDGPAGEPTTTHNVQPDFEEGNPRLCTFSDAPEGFRINDPSPGTFFDPNNPDFSITLTAPSENPPDPRLHEGPTFDFVASGGVVEVILVKGGPNANSYDFVAETGGGVVSDTYLHSPVNPSNDRYYGLSHIDVCYDEAPAEIEIEKTAVADTITVGDHAAFDITVTSVGATTAENVTIDDDLPNTVLDWEIVSESDPGSCTIPDGNTLECDVGDLATGESFTVSVQTTEPILLGSDFCGETFDNTAFAEADNADLVSDDASIDVICGAIEVNKFAKVPGTEDTQPVAGAGFTLFDNGDAIDPPGEVLTDDDGIACFDGLPVNTEFRLSETTTPAGYATVDDRTVTSSADHADCDGAGAPTVVEVENLALTDISWEVTSQVEGGTETLVECWFGEIDGAPDFSTTVGSGSHTFEDLLPTDPDVTLTCQFTVDP